MPLYVPPDAVPEPARIDATWVPWPTVSVTPAGSPVKSCAPTTTPARSGCVGSYPVSSTATRTSRPVYPACQAAGAPICAALRSSDG
jgi:hypothetical protein